jgi:uncharacterized protein (TIGR03083 family)
MRFDYLRLMHEESRDLADFLAGLSDDDWEAPTLCAGWRVREVVSHMGAGHTAPLGGYVALLMRARFSVDRASDRLARTFAAEHSPAEILATFRRGTSGRPKGPTALVPRGELFTDHLIHHQDIRRPLGRTRVIPELRLAAALHSLAHLSGRVGSKARMRGLRVVCEDVEFTRGEGAEVRGTAEALVMALCGRRAPAAELRGEGADLLSRRLAAEGAVRSGGQAGTGLMAGDAAGGRP